MVGISAVLLLIGVFAGPALAEHATPGPAVVPTVETFPGGDPICPAGTTGIRFGGGGASLDSGTSSGGVTITHDGTTLSFTTDGVLVAKVFMKGGNDQNVYDYSGFTGGGVAHDDGLTSPINPNNNTPFGISHVDFCVFTPDPTPTPEATPTPTDPPTPTPTDPPTPTPTDPPTPTPEATPTPSPTLPDTFTAPTTGLDGAGGQGTIFLLLLIGTAVGAWLLLKPVRRREDEA